MEVFVKQNGETGASLLLEVHLWQYHRDHMSPRHWECARHWSQHLQIPPLSSPDWSHDAVCYLTNKDTEKFWSWIRGLWLTALPLSSGPGDVSLESKEPKCYREGENISVYDWHVSSPAPPPNPRPEPVRPPCSLALNYGTIHLITINRQPLPVCHPTSLSLSPDSFITNGLSGQSPILWQHSHCPAQALTISLLVCAKPL